jgi:hypothetical protein
MVFAWVIRTNFKELYATAQLIYDMGAGQTTRIITVTSILTLVGVWRSTLEFYGIPMIVAIVVLAVGFVLSNLVIGVYFYKSGMYKTVIDVSNRNNVQWQEVRENQKKIMERLGIADGGKK